ncbi:MAG: cupin domain-containing protein [Acidobacteriota bacterium]
MTGSVETIFTAERLFSPLGLSTFVAQYWQSQHLLLQRDHSSHYGDLFRLRDIDRYLTLAAETGLGNISLIRDGKVTRKLRPRGLDVRQLYSALGNGSTLLFEQIDHLWMPVRELAADLARSLSARVKVNVYLTPPGRQGAPIHPDIQDVFVLQLEGAKEWHLYGESMYEPVETTEYLTELGYRRPVMPKEPEAMPPVTLEPGDLLYMPRGLLHRAVAPADRPSLHLTVCATPIYWVDFLKVAIEAASLERPELAAALPPGFEWAGVDATLQEAFESAVDLVRRGTSFATVAQAFAQRTEKLPGDGHFHTLLHLEEITAETVLEARTGSPCEIVHRGDKVELRCGSIKLQGPAGVAQAFERIRDRPRLRVAEFSEDLSAEAKVSLARRLVSEGLLRVAGRAVATAEGAVKTG